MRGFYGVKEELDPRVKPNDDGIVIPAKAGIQLNTNTNDDDFYDDDEDDEKEETDKQYLLLGFRNCRNEEANTHHQEKIGRCEHIKREDISPEG